MLEEKIKQLQKDLNDKVNENEFMTQSIRDVTAERDLLNKKAEELESRQQSIETDYLNESIKLTNSFNPHNGLMGYKTLPNNTNHSSTLPFSVPPDISPVDIQLLLSLGIKLDTQAEQQKAFDIIRQKKDLSEMMEALTKQ